MREAMTVAILQFSHLLIRTCEGTDTLRKQQSVLPTTIAIFIKTMEMENIIHLSSLIFPAIMDLIVINDHCNAHPHCDPH